MGNKLSHSAATRYQTCPKSFELHYRRKLRPKIQSSALLFGSALDAGITSLLKGEEKQSAEDVFTFFWRFQDVNGTRQYLTTYTNIVYANSDMDVDLLQKEDYEKIKEICSVESVDKELEEVLKEKEYFGFKGLREERKKFLNVCNWFCLYRKGLIMIKTFKEKVLPNIIEVLGTQVYVKLDNGAGDTIVGFADMVVRWKDIKEPVILDLKTSSKEYDEELSVITSPQLTLYVHALSDQFENTRKAGYIVLNKHIRKNKEKKCSKCGNDGTGGRHKTCNATNPENGERCNGEWIETFNPEAKVQLLIEDIPEQTEEIVLENMDHINEAINNGQFHRNLGNCQMAWGPCTFFNLCYYGKDDELIDTSKEEK